MQRIYLDACALNRLTDDQTQPRIYDEARAMERILNKIASGDDELLASDVLTVELSANPDPIKRRDALQLLHHARHMLFLTQTVLQRGAILEELGYGAFDSLHLACAEEMSADVLITTDDRFLKLTARGVGNPKIKLKNPINWLEGRLIV